MTQPGHDTDTTQTCHSDTSPQRTHTIASIANDANTTERTVRRWLSKCGVLGEMSGNTRYFSDTERDQLMSHQTKRATTAQPIEPEIIEPGAIELHRSEGSTVTPIVPFNLEPVQIDLPTTDLTAITAQTEQLEATAQQGANAIASYFAARFDMGLATIAAKQDNLLKGIEAQALNGAARSVSNAQQQPGK